MFPISIPELFARFDIDCSSDELLRLQRRQALIAYITLPVSFQRVRHVAKDFNRVHLRQREEQKEIRNT